MRRLPTLLALVVALTLGLPLAVSEGGTALVTPDDIAVTDPDSSSFTFKVSNVTHGTFQTTTDGEEGRQAFNEKRPPNFTGALRRRGEAWEEPSEEDAKRLDEAYRSGEF